MVFKQNIQIRSRKFNRKSQVHLKVLIFFLRGKREHIENITTRTCIWTDSSICKNRGTGQRMRNKLSERK